MNELFAPSPEQKGTKLEALAESGNMSEVTRLLQWEANHKPEEFQSVAEAFAKKNEERRNDHSLSESPRAHLPKVELHKDFLGFGKVDDIHVQHIVNDRFGRMSFHNDDVYNKPEQVAEAPAMYTQSGQQALPEMTIQGIEPEKTVDVGSPLRAVENMFSSFFGNKNEPEQNTQKIHNGQELPKAGFQSYIH